jgi:hypothetical protein
VGQRRACAALRGHDGRHPATTAHPNSLRLINQWIVFGIIGLLVVVAAIVIERKLEDIKAWREVLETWE